MEEKGVEGMVNILKKLCSAIEYDSSISAVERKRLFIPDEQCFLHPITEICFDDMYEVQLRGCKYVKIVHPSINQTVIKTLGIMSKRKFHLSKFSCGIPFGKKEKLVTRLKGIISAYLRDHLILNELLQNADDAGASDIHFILDRRQHRTKHIF